MAMFDEEGGSRLARVRRSPAVRARDLPVHLGDQLLRRQPQDQRPHAGTVRQPDVGLGALDLGVSALAIFAALSLFGGGRFGRIVAYLWAASVLVQSFTTISIAPWYSALTIALAVMVVYGLASSPRVQSA